jgi:hypothetical protein
MAAASIWAWERCDSYLVVDYLEESLATAEADLLGLNFFP